MKSKRRDRGLQSEARRLAAKLSIKYHEALHVTKARRAAKADEEVRAKLPQEEASGETKVASTEPRVQRSPLVQPGEYFTLNSWDTADGKTRLLVSMGASDEEFAAAEEAIAQSDRDLEMLKKTREFIDSFEDDEEVISRCTNVPGGKQIKVTYIDRDGSTTQAYIHEDTGEGTNKHSDIPVVIKWFEDQESWRQVDPWDWNWDEREGWVRDVAGA